MTTVAPGAVHELGESLAIGARRVLPAAHAKRLVLAWDVRGDRVETFIAPTRIIAAMYRVLHGLVDLMSVGAVIVETRVIVSDRGQVRCEIHAGASGLLVRSGEVSGVMHRLDLREAEHSGDGRPGARQADGSCPATGGTVNFACRPGEGAVFHLTLELPVAARQAPLDVDGARAWIVDANGFCGDALAARLQRRGWATTRIGSPTVAERRLRTMPAAQTAPALVIVAEGSDVDSLQLARLRRALPAASRCVHLVTSGSPALLHPTDVELRVAPLSPRDLDELAALAPTPVSPSGLTLPAPLRWVERGSLLVVDDEPVNRIIACQMGELLGFDAEAVDSGPAALERCARQPPDAVLMDLRMPGLDGLETTRRLRALQVRGLVPPFPIIGATAEDEQLRAACLDAGMSAFLVKPLMLDALRDALLQQCAGCIAEAA